MDNFSNRLQQIDVKASIFFIRIVHIRLKESKDKNIINENKMYHTNT